MNPVRKTRKPRCRKLSRSQCAKRKTCKYAVGKKRSFCRKSKSRRHK